MKFFDSLWLDARVAVRWLLKNRGTTALAVLSIGLGVGLTTALFSVADAMLFRPYPFTRPAELHAVRSIADDHRGIDYGWLDYEEMARACAGSAELAAVGRHGLMLTGELNSELLLAYSVSKNFFGLLGVRAELGQTEVSTTGDGRPQVVLSRRFWQRRFGGDRRAIGQTLVFNGVPCVVAGVMPAEVTGIIRGVPCDVFIGAEAWFDARRDARARQSRQGNFELLLRAPAGTALEPIAARLDAAIRGDGARKPAPAGMPGTQLVQPFILSQQAKLEYGGGAFAGLVLLLFVACANAAQLRLAQTEARKKEMGVRLALGSGSWRLARLLLLETIVVGVAGAAAGLYLADTVLTLASRAVASAWPFFDFGFAIDWRAGGFALAATVGATLLAGISPMRHALRLDVLEILKSEQGVGGGKRRLQRVLIAGQTAASVVFFGFALLFTLSFRHAADVWPGFDASRPMLVFSVGPALRVPRPTWCEQACERLRALGSVREATYTVRLPLSASGGGARARLEPADQAPLAATIHKVAPNYFAAMRLHVLAGRGIAAADTAQSTLVAVISQELARRLGASGAVGGWLKIDGRPRQIVGLAEDAPWADLHETPEPCVYVPYAQQPIGDLTLLVETTGDPAALTKTVQQELKRYDAGVLLYNVTTLQRHVEQALFQDRAAASASTAMGALGFALTAAGLFGMVQYTVHRRTRELGVRMALGAAPRTIRSAVLRESLLLVLPGIALGLALLGAGAWSVRALLLGVHALDPRAYGLCALAAIAVALLAAWLPAHRATRIDPVDALRAE